MGWGGMELKEVLMHLIRLRVQKRKEVEGLLEVFAEVLVSFAYSCLY